MDINEIRRILSDHEDRIARMEVVRRNNRRYIRLRDRIESDEELYDLQIRTIKKRCYNLATKLVRVSADTSSIKDSTVKWAAENEGWMPMSVAFGQVANHQAFLVSGTKDKRMDVLDFLKLVSRIVVQEVGWEVITPTVAMARFGSYKPYVRIAFKDEFEHLKP